MCIVLCDSVVEKVAPGVVPPLKGVTEEVTEPALLNDPH